VRRLISGPWPFRIAWALLPVLAGPALGGALADASGAVQTAATIGLWIGWALVLLAASVPRAVTLTVVRLATPAPLAASVVAAIAGPAGADDAVALGAAVAVVATALLPATADAFVDGSSYGSERRFALRTPRFLLLAAAPVAWVLAVAVPAAAVLTVAAGAWAAGAALAFLGLAGIALGVPAVHRLSLRWLVFVPAGVVVHDRLALADPVLLGRRVVRAIGPAAPPGGDGDLTLGTGGLALVISLTQSVDLALARGLGRNRQAVEVHLERIVVAPHRPGAVLSEAEARRLPVYRAVADPTTQSPA